MSYSKSFIRFWVKKIPQGKSQFLSQNAQHEIFKILKMFKNNTKFTGQPVELTQKLATETVTPHLWYFYVVNIAGDYYKVFNAVELHILKSLKVNCSNTVSSLYMQPIFNKQLPYDGHSVEKHCFLVLNVKLQVKLRFKMFY